MAIRYNCLVSTVWSLLSNTAEEVDFYIRVVRWSMVAALEQISYDKKSK